MTTTRFAPSPTGYIHIGNLRTALLWAAPALVLVAGLVVTAGAYRRRSPAAGDDTLSDTEKAQVDRILADK